ncbi:hydrogenase expression/formation protein HypE [Candidatus Bathyarchaeota archaeon]|nr:hydrogenase expression/formation protein HypE [Candidatus Bathyarchaeota archaeon]
MEGGEIIKLSHGAGGAYMDELIRRLFLEGFKLRKALDGVGLDALDDGASLRVGDMEVVVSIDGHTVDPIFFPGGDLGRLAISGAVNDVAVMGARPVAILDAIIVEEGYSIEKLRRLVRSMNETAQEAGVAIISGDFKVMPRGHLDRVVITTCSIGFLEAGRRILDSGARPGDKVIITGPIGDHGIALMSAREGLEFETELRSDVAPIWCVVEAALKAGEVRAMKDPTRGGLSAALNTIAEKSGVSIWIDEDRVPIREEVRAASEMLGLDPYEVTCEGRAIIIVSPETAEDVLRAVRRTRYGGEAEIIGEVRGERPGYVLLRTMVGGTRVLRKPLGEPIPRVC